jgi:hypothetical protein
VLLEEIEDEVIEAFQIRDTFAGDGGLIGGEGEEKDEGGLRNPLNEEGRGIIGS